MVFCSNCGTELGKDQKFCPNCGNRNESIIQETTSDEALYLKEQETESAVKPTPLKVSRQDERENKVERARDKAKKGFGAALSLARKGIKKGRDAAEKGIETAKETIEERKMRQEAYTEKKENFSGDHKNIKFCPECGKSVTVGNKFCNHCGAKLE